MTDMSRQPEEKTEDPSHLGFKDLISLCLELNGRLDSLWQRVLYAHAAIVAVMVFFATNENNFLLPRILVFAFYTANTVITIYAFTETLTGLKAVVKDLRALQGETPRTQVQAWVFAHNYDRHAIVRLLILAATWAVLGYLLIVPPLVCAEGRMEWTCTQAVAPSDVPKVSVPPS